MDTPLKAQFQSAAKELKYERGYAQQAVREIERIRRQMPKTFKNFETFLTKFQYAVFNDLRRKGTPTNMAEQRARELAGIIRQAKWINMRRKITANARKKPGPIRRDAP